MLKFIKSLFKVPTELQIPFPPQPPDTFEVGDCVVTTQGTGFVVGLMHQPEGAIVAVELDGGETICCDLSLGNSGIKKIT